ncbi:hypothetical protein L6452_06264 [Arctium lappa]|uniref:Uncharacterized protein n=1 Tax=Arctium lappa TaxID=4217 RepID=A0ACB9EI21_ARCLA|nr:hypothetical protein L6452_06264 [Arctium lappa]
MMMICLMKLIFLNSEECSDECVEKFDFNAKLPDQPKFVVNSEELPSVFEVGESSTKVDDIVPISAYYAEDMRYKRFEGKHECRPKKGEESAKSFSVSECYRTSNSCSDVVDQFSSIKQKLVLPCKIYTIKQLIQLSHSTIQCSTCGRNDFVDRHYSDDDF